jgi:inhibitor of cysteine peptidase
MNRFIYNSILMMVLMLALPLYSSISGCAGGSDVGNPESITFASDEALTAYFVDQYAQSAMPDRLQTESSDNDMAAPGDSDGAGYSETNVQEAGVDESDKVKTDGTYLYVAGDTGVDIIDTTFEDGMKKVSRIDVDGYVVSLYLYADTLIILYTPDNGSGNKWAGEDDIEPTDIDIGIGMPYWIPVNAKIGILIADISDPEYPLIIKNIQADGFLVSSRLTGGRLYIISQYFPDIPPLEQWYDESEEERSDAYNTNKQKLDDLTLDDFIPSYQEYDATGFMTEAGRLIATEDFLRPKDSNGGTIVSIITIDLTDLSKDFESLGFIADVHHVYASTDNLYLVSAKYNHFGDIETDTETPALQTLIYQFDLAGATVRYTAVGSVPGQILNQFSLSEYEHVLRIATSTGNTWDGSAENHVYCLNKNNDKLDIIGRIEGLAPGEKLYASRFIGDKGFLVTFVEIDPLFTLDLSDPRNPSVAGELKVPGYSTYIHQIGENHLLTIGKDVVVENNSVWYQGLQMSLFDISDFANPELIAVEKIGDRGTESEALFNHKALTFRSADNLIALPVDLYEHLSPPSTPWEYGTQTFHGLYVYKITDENDFDHLGKIQMTPKTYDFYLYQGWIRGIFIDENIYAVSANTVKVAEIESMDEVSGSIDEGALSQTNEKIQKIGLTENLNEIVTGPEYKIRSSKIEGDMLELCIEYGGGCEDHIFSLYAESIFSESFPVQGYAKISHNDFGDSCEALIVECFEYDLEPIRNLYLDSYQQSEGTILINIEGIENPINFTF